MDKRCATDTGPYTVASTNPRAPGFLHYHERHELPGGWKLCRRCDGFVIGQHVGEPSWWGKVLEAIEAEAGEWAERMIADGG